MLSAMLTHDLAKRLIDQPLNGLDMEHALVAKLKFMHGITFATKMERMCLVYPSLPSLLSSRSYVIDYQDIALSDEQQQNFNSWNKPVVMSPNDTRVVLHPIVLANGRWPSNVLFNGAFSKCDDAT